MEILILKNVKKNINILDASTQAKIIKIIGLLEIKEYYLGMPYSKAIEKDLYELRILGKHNIRIFYTIKSNSAILLHIISKKSQKLDKNVINAVRERIKLLKNI